MFDIAFSELVVIAIIALIVIGPEKLPKVARTLGALTGRMQRYIAQIKEEVNREDRFAELQKLQQEIQHVSDSAQSKLQTDLSSVTHDREIRINHDVTDKTSQTSPINTPVKD